MLFGTNGRNICTRESFNVPQPPSGLTVLNNIAANWICWAFEVQTACVFLRHINFSALCTSAFASRRSYVWYAIPLMVVYVAAEVSDKAQDLHHNRGNQFKSLPARRTLYMHHHTNFLDILQGGKIYIPSITYSKLLPLGKGLPKC